MNNVNNGETNDNETIEPDNETTGASGTSRIKIISFVIILLTIIVPRISNIFSDYDEYVDSPSTEETIPYSDSDSYSKKTSTPSNGNYTSKSGAAATDFEVTGGSSNVYLISARNYGVICSHCGYDGGAMGTWDINYRVSGHKAGDRENLNMSMKCASSFKGGCGEISDYRVSVRYK